MFDNPRFITRGIENTLSPALQNILWYLIESMPAEPKDYLQVFHLYEQDGAQMVRHTQEQPPYERIDSLPGLCPIAAKVFVIDDTLHTTMLLADEY